jgi:two-component sensor histidine kinase
MALHELCTNALKYGALAVETGTVKIEWASYDGELRLRWCEIGGPPVAPPGRKGFGTRLLTAGLFDSGNGHVELAFERTGVVCDIRVAFSPV